MARSGWDLIVVGAGSSGAVLAARSAAAGKRVLLLEAGRDYRSAQLHEAWRSPNPIVPLMEPAAVAGMFWPGLFATRTEKQEPQPYWRGRGVGGCSSINGQIAIRPPVEEFDDWAAVGCVGWSAADVLPYFARLEDDSDFGDEPYHGRGGPTPIYRTPQGEWAGVDTALSRSAQVAGFGWAPDVNAPAATGVSPYPINSRDGQRVSVNDGYLEPARDLGGLTIRGGALVDKLLFAGDRVVGVQFVADGALESAYADTTALCAGAIHTPAILLRSGVGPAADLRLLDLEVRQDLPVGRGLQDHPMALVMLPLAPEATITSRDGRHTNVCVRWTSSADAPVNDMLFMSLNQVVLPSADAAGAFGVWLSHNCSRGLVSLTSADPSVQPRVDQRMLSDERDAARLRQGVRTLVELADSDEAAGILAGNVATANAELFAVLDSDAELDDFLLATIGDAQHATSTCPMGRSDASGTVVDHECRVLGLDGVRVVDASIFPTVPRANPNLTTIMIGEAMADRLG